MSSESNPATTSSSPATQTEASASPDTPATSPLTTYRDVPLALIQANHDRNDRFALDPQALQQLADSIARCGLINPVTLRRHEDHFQLVAGYRRLEACRLLGKRTVHARIVDSDSTPDATTRLAENLVRADLSPVEEARCVDQLMSQSDRTPDQLATILHRSPAWIRHRLALANYPEELLEPLHTKAITLGVADELALVHDPQQRAALLEAAARNGCTAAQAALWRAHANAFLGDTTTAATQPSPPPVQGPPPVVTKTCFLCTIAHPITTLSYLTVCPTCLRAMKDAQQQPPPPPPTAPTTHPAAP